MTQDFVVYLIVAGAVLYLVRMLTASVKGKKSCGSCGSGKSCTSSSTQKANAEPQLIQISLGSSTRKPD